MAQQQILKKITSRAALVAQASFSLVFFAFSAYPSAAAAGTCQTPSPSYGSVTTTVSVPATATYRVWSRIMAPDASNNTYYLNIDSSNCFNVGGSGVSTTNWTWVDYQDGSAASKVELPLNQGSHTVILTGNKPNVKLDHVIFTSDLACVPTGSGDNCNVPSDTAPPVVHVTAPADSTTVTGTVQVAATATDNTGVAKVELYANSVLKATSVTPPYAFDLDTTKLTNGQQRLTAKAYDAAGNFASDSVTVLVQNNDTQAPSKPTNFTAKAPDYSKVTLAWTASTDNVAIKGYRILRNGSLLVDLNNVTAYDDVSVLPGTAYAYEVQAIDTSSNYSAGATASVTTPQVTDTQAPTAPSGLAASVASSSQINLTWTASTDNTGVAAYDVYRAKSSNASKKVATVTTTSYGDTGLDANTKYTYYVIARDASNNASNKSNQVSATTARRQRTGVIQGTVRDAATQKPIANATVNVTGQGRSDTYRTDDKGSYAIRRVNASRYTVTYRARNHKVQTLSIQMTNGGVVTKDVMLTGK